MAQGLNIDSIVRVEVDLTPEAAAPRNFGILMVVGDSDVINGQDLLRTYFTLEAVADDFGTTAPEYLAAQLYFAQSPQPQELIIGRWLRTATAAELRGGILTVAEQAMSNWTPILDGTFEITIDGVLNTVVALDFSLETNLNGVASIINAAPGLTGGTITWDGARFIMVSDTTGVTSTITFASVEGTGTDISAMLKLDSATALAPVDGFAATTALQAIVDLANASGDWYAASFASSVQPSNTGMVDVAAFIQSATPKRIFCVTETNVLTLDAAYTLDLPSLMKAGGYTRTTVQYSENDYAICSYFGRAATVDFTANNSTITLMFKQEPSVVPETITASQAETLKEKRCNVFVRYLNNTAIIQHGVMSGDAYFDEIHGLDWFANALQTAEFNLLLGTNKVPQTEAGQNQVLNTAAAVCSQAVSNGLIAPGTWNSSGFGQLNTGDYLPSGFYIYSAPISQQNQAIRDLRIAPTVQIAVKLAGAIQEIDIIVEVNR